jgi:hypothetical protein
MLTESATQRLDLPFTDTVSIATSIDQALRNLAPADRKLS